ncbi:heavy-metal-associated domain-containing protein [Catalinimonas niigatensis]|nr:heavy-metal-associated domain-containing protein [Catalinimonas niigatensis]WPP48602.1 heavy-metal-associated domain-containing protein [Catalinimonas niigatensis]
MKTIQFKTNIKCNGCIAAVKPHLNEAVGEEHWKVDLNSPDRILTVEAEDEQQVKEAVQKAGYQAEKIR